MATADALIATLDTVDVKSFKSEYERTRARDAIHAALQRVQSPWETALHHVWTEPATIAVLKTCIDVDLFKKWVRAGTDTPKTASELASLAGIEPVLMSRLLRQMAALKHIDEVAQDTYRLTPFSAELAKPAFPSLYTFLSEVNGPGFLNLPGFLKSIGYKNPTDAAANNIQHWKGPGENFFKYIASSPAITQAFQDSMGVYVGAKTPWTELYPTDSIVDALKPGKALVVDVGGGHGYDLEIMRSLHPDVPSGSLVLQDKPEVVSGVSVTEPAVARVHDFFLPNPEQGARVYYLHCILHDWPDADAVKILQSLVPAMERAYSRVLLHENVIAARAPHPRTTTSDLTMLMSFNAAERDETTWRELVGKAGLSVVKIWDSPEAVESIIELELP